MKCKEEEVPLRKKKERKRKWEKLDKEKESRK
jgi:hypothetical protein